MSGIGLVSTLFPELPAHGRRSFQIAMAAFVAWLAVAAVLRLPGLFIATVAVGIPLLFVLYARQLDYRGPAKVRLLVSTGLGAWVGKPLVG